MCKAVPRHGGVPCARMVPCSVQPMHNCNTKSSNSPIKSATQLQQVGWANPALAATFAFAAQGATWGQPPPPPPQVQHHVVAVALPVFFLTTNPSSQVIFSFASSVQVFFPPPASRGLPVVWGGVRRNGILYAALGGVGWSGLLWCSLLVRGNAGGGRRYGVT